MKAFIISSVFLIQTICLFAQSDEPVIIGKKEAIFSKVLNENRKIWVYTPTNTSQNVSLAKRYPVMYVLDGEAHFYSSVGIIQQLSQANGNGVLPEMIVIGIENTNRIRDLVPSIDVNNTNPFIEFISNELIPYVDKNFPTAPYKLLVGHSLGGLTVIDLLSNKPSLFNAYIAIDPSMWYANETYLKKAIAQLSRQKMSGKKLFIGSANTLPKGMTLSQLKTDTSPETQPFRSILKLDNFLKKNTNGLMYAHQYYQKERHNTLPLLCTYDGFRFIFDYYFLDLSVKDFSDSSPSIASTLKMHYEKVSESMGYKNAAPESLINYLAYDAIGKQHLHKAKALVELNIEWYPESSYVYTLYADYWLAVKDTAKAIANYQKALKLKKDSTVLRKLNALTINKTFTYSKDYLKKFSGTYTLVAFNLDMKLVFRDEKLWAIVPGQEDSEFLPISENEFTVKGKQGYTITFEMINDKPKGFTSVQPNGVFKAIIKNE